MTETVLHFNIESIPMERRPKHVAIIMDGNGRWARARNLPRSEGHQEGAKAIQRTLECCEEFGITTLTLFCFSSENWKRPKEELDFLMQLLVRYLRSERLTLQKEGIQLRVLGRRDGLSPEVVAELDETEAQSSPNAKFTLCLAINYGGRQELVDAFKAISGKVQSGELHLDDIDEDTISNHLYSAGLSDPDLLIRTSGEMRISNFLLWQISYSEIWVTNKTWPEFDRETLLSAIQDYSLRERRFGAIGVGGA